MCAGCDAVRNTLVNLAIYVIARQTEGRPDPDKGRRKQQQKIQWNVPEQSNQTDTEQTSRAWQSTMEWTHSSGTEQDSRAVDEEATSKVQ